MSENEKRCKVYLAPLSNEVTGSCNLVTVKTSTGKRIKFLVDCGMFQEQEYADWNNSFPFKSKEIDFILITHTHIDHIGRLPLAIKEGFGGKIFLTHGAKILSKPALKNNYEIIEKDAKRDGVEPLFTEQDVKQTNYHMVGVDFRKPIQVAPGITVTFFENGHCVGSAMILVQIEDEVNILFTGDYKPENDFFDVPELKREVRELPLYLITESTYGNSVSSDVEYTFVSNVFEAVKNQEDIVILAPAFERIQKEMFKVRCMQEKGMIPKHYLIALDGNLAQENTDIFLKEPIGISEDMTDFIPFNLEFVDSTSRKEFLERTSPKIIFTTSGMGSFGPAQVYIPVVLQDRPGLVQFTCYQAEGTFGRKLKDTKDSDIVIINEKNIIKRGRVEFSEEDSSHAKADELLQFIQSFANLKYVFITHGETDVKRIFQNKVKHALNTSNVEVMQRDAYFEFDKDCLKKVLPSNF